ALCAVSVERQTKWSPFEKVLGASIVLLLVFFQFRLLSCLLFVVAAAAGHSSTGRSAFWPFRFSCPSISPRAVIPSLYAGARVGAPPPSCRSSSDYRCTRS